MKVFSNAFSFLQLNRLFDFEIWLQLELFSYKNKNKL